MLAVKVVRLLAGAFLAACVAATDDGDDFSNNLFSDLAPLLALFGERVTMQFMSQSTGWSDNIILAMAPLGIITAIVGAIRVGGPTWLRAIIGRSRENRAVVEAELMSSTSEEVCELWNGRDIVRVMGAGPIREFIILVPEEGDGDRGSVNEVQVRGLRDRKSDGSEAEDRYLRKYVPTLRDSIFDPSKVVGVFKSALKKNNPLHSGDIEKAVQKTPDDTHSEVPDISNDPGLGTGGDGRPVVVIRNLDSPAPSLTLNVRSRVSRGELYLVAILGTLLQLGVLAFSGYTAYHPGVKSNWLKDGKSVADYAFPCNAAGTLLLVMGVLVCSHVVEGSTSETRYRPVGDEARIVWLQKSGTVNDQTFESYAIFPRQPQTLITTSHRSDTGDSPPVLILGETIAVIGTMVSLCGFVAQFVGLRSMHWSSSIAQLAAVALMVALRAWVRRNFARLPASHRLLSGYEMDWLAMTLTSDLARASWRSPPKAGGATQGGNGGVGARNNGELNQPSRPWDWKTTAVEPPETLQALKDADSTNSNGFRTPLETRAHRAMILRRDLGEVSDWQGMASAEAIALARAIEITMDTLFDTKPGGNEKLTWHLSTSSSWAGSSVAFRVEQLETGHWKAFSDELEAGLSLWLYSVAELENAPEYRQRADDQQVNLGNRKTRRGPRGGHLEFKSMRGEDDKWLRIKGKQTKRSLRLLGQSTDGLIRDIRWWIPDTSFVEARLEGERRDNGNRIEVEEHRIVGSASNWGSGSHIYVQDLIPDEGTSAPDNGTSVSADDRATWTVAVDSPMSLTTLFAQHMFSAFMWAAAKKMKSPIPGGAEIRPSGRDNEPTVWTSFALRNVKLHTMAQGIQGTGLGSLGDVYLAIIPPLSIERKLPQPDALVEWTRKHADPRGQSMRQRRTTNAYLWLLQVTNGLQEDISTRAVALLMEHLRVVIDNIALLEGHCIKTNLQQSRDERDIMIEALCAVDHRPLAFILGLYQKQGRPWERPPPEWPQPSTHSPSDRVRKLDSTMHASHPKHRVVFAQLDEKDMLGWTPLHYETKKKKPSVLEYQGADINAQDLHGRTPLHYACQVSRGGHRDLRDFFRGGANVTTRDAHGMAPVHYAARFGDDTMVRWLIEVGVGADLTDWLGNTPLHIAAYAGNKATLMVCLQYGNVKVRNYAGRTALHLAAIGEEGSPEERKGVVEALMETAGVDKEEEDYSGWTPLELAARSGQEAAAEALIKMGARNELKEEMAAPIHLAAENGQVSVVKLLVELGIDKNLRNGINWTPLFYAASHGQEAVVRYLVEQGADVNQEPLPPLSAAAREGHEAVVRFLVQQGADMEADYSSTDGSALCAAANHGHESIIRFLVKEGANIEARGVFGKTPLHSVAAIGRVALVKFFLEHGADMEAKDDQNWTPLHHAADWGHADVVKILLEHGADTETKSNSGKTPLNVAIEAPRGSAAAIDLLR